MDTVLLMDPKPLKVIQDVPMRWSSTFNMIERMLDLKKAITLIHAELNVPIDISSLCQKVCDILGVFADAVKL